MAPTFADPEEAVRYAQYVEAQAEEYNTWVAAADIYVGNVVGYRPGHQVPKSVVEAQGWDKQGIVVPAGGPIPEPGVDRQQQLKERMEALEKERAAIEAELGGSEPTVAELRNQLRAKELPVSGTKDELVARLAEAEGTE